MVGKDGGGSDGSLDLMDRFDARTGENKGGSQGGCQETGVGVSRALVLADRRGPWQLPVSSE